MYISSFGVKDLKCFKKVDVVFPGTAGHHAGWHVFLGINGTGKSTLLQAMALAMLGPVSGGRLVRQPASLVREGARYAEVRASLTTGARDTTNPGTPRRKRYEAHLVVTGARPVTVDGLGFVEPQVALFRRTLARSLNSGPHSSRRGWFSAGYGPFRRLSGAGGEVELSIQYGPGREARHLTLFSESAALTRGEKWLASLHSQSVDPALPLREVREVAAQRLSDARRIIDGLLPNGVRIETVTSLGVTFSTRSGAKVALSQLSDGFRSFLALTIDLLRHILDGEAYRLREDATGPSVDTAGVVLIDEADAHLHPTWQRDIGFRMCEVFPKIQFIVSSHSPFVAQAAKPGGLFQVKPHEKQTLVEPADQSVRGWRADQILLSSLFGLDSTRDPETEGMLTRRTELRNERALKPKEGRELAKIEEGLRHRLTAPGDTFEERERHDKMKAFVDARLTNLAQEAPTSRRARKQTRGAK